jgi:hypothetical protein
LIKHSKNGKNIPNNHEISQMATKYTKWLKNRPKCHNLSKHLPLQDPPKFTQIGIFWFINLPSGNPGGRRRRPWKMILQQVGQKNAPVELCDPEMVHFYVLF